MSYIINDLLLADGGATTPTITATFLHAEGIKVNGGDTVEMFKKYSTSQDFGTIAGNATATATFTATGINQNTMLFAGRPDEVDDAIVVGASVFTADVALLTIHNTANSSASAPTATYNALTVRFT